ncbi:MAG: hypothetical protein ACYCX4_00495 [Bacillota bacterium]
MHKSLAKEYFQRQAALMEGSPVFQTQGIALQGVGENYLDVAIFHPADKLYYLLRLDCENYDFQPPLAYLLDPRTKERLQDQWWPTSALDHSLYGKTFCLSGTRGYHDYDSHIGDIPYYMERNSLTLEGVIMDLRQKIMQGNFPRGGPYDGWQPELH